MTTLNRRRFLAATLAASVTKLPAIGADTPPRKGMTLGFSTYGTKSLKTEQALALIDDAGFDAVEMTVQPGWDATPSNMPPKRRREIRDMLVDRGLKLTSFMEHIYPSKDDAVHKQQLDRLKTVFELGRDLSPKSAPVVQTVLGGGQWEQQKTLFRDRVADWGRLGEKYRVVVCIKPHRGGGMSRPSEAVWIFKSLDNPRWLRMVYDYSHYIFRDIPLVESIREAAPYTAHVAVKDTIKQGDRTAFVLPGEAGTIDFATLLRELQKAGYAGDISCEVSGMVWGKQGYDPRAAIKTCYRNLSKAFIAADVARSRGA
ncbi:MAG: sugar phosphate isomerase/epimerase [Planctomycetota bacterium]|nr:sugar phosphate isomerase/epimerase [Planctomycetota bacterium]